MSYEKHIKQFLADRKTAFLSMDRPTIEAYMKKYGEAAPEEDRKFWIVVHMARTGAIDLPMAARSESKAWLLAQGLHSLDDGDVPVPANNEPA